MNLLILGCSGSLNSPDNAASGYLLTSDRGEQLLLDCGPGVLSRLQYHSDPSQVHVALSHVHPDHCLDFPSLMIWRRFHPTKKATRRHQFIGPAIAPQHLGRAASDYLDQVDDFSDSFSICSLAEQPGEGFRVGEELRVTSAPAIHPSESYCLRVDSIQGQSFVYSGDTAYTEELISLAKGADLFLCEATWGANSVGKVANMHMDGEEAGYIAAQAGVKELVLTHIPPWGDPQGAVEAAQKQFDGPIRLAEPNLRISI